MHRFILLLISAHDKLAGGLMGLVCTEWSGPHPYFPRPCVYLRVVFGVHVQSTPAPSRSLMRTPRNERLICVYCTALHSTALRMHIIGPRLQPEPRITGPQTVHPNAAGAIVARTS